MTSAVPTGARAAPVAAAVAHSEAPAPRRTEPEVVKARQTTATSVSRFQPHAVNESEHPDAVVGGFRSSTATDVSTSHGFAGDFSSGYAQMPVPASPDVKAVGEQAAQVSVVALAPRKSAKASDGKRGRGRFVVLASEAQEKTSRIVGNPHFKVVSISTASGVVVLGGLGGAFGCFGGMLIGGAAGTIPALLTFGTSIPVGAVLGGAVGAPAGACAGGLGGALLSGAAGHGAYVWRAEIKNGVLSIRCGADKLRLALAAAANNTKEFTVSQSKRIQAYGAFARAEAVDLAGFLTFTTRKVASEAVADRRLRVTAASAAAGAVAGATSGGAAGTVVGAGTGAMVGLPAALFTFGLSIPFCAAIGGGLGGAAGAAGGGAAGGVAGGAAGYGAHTYRKEIAGGATTAWSQLRGSTGRLQATAKGSVTRVASLVRGGSGTGGTVA